MSKTLPEYSSLVRWTVNDVCVWLMENGFPNFVRNFRENGVDGSRLADLSNQDLQRMRCPLNKQSELLRCVKSVERKDIPTRQTGSRYVRLNRIFRRKSITELVNFSLARVSNIVSRPPPKQPEPPQKDYTQRAAPPAPSNGYPDDEGSGPDDDYEEWGSEFEDESDSFDSDEDYENQTSNEIRNQIKPPHGHHAGHQKKDINQNRRQQSPPQPASIPPRPPPDSDSEGSYEEPSVPDVAAPPIPGLRPGNRPPHPTPQKATPQKATLTKPVFNRRVPPPPQDEDQPVYEEPDEEQKPQEISKPLPTTRPPVTGRRLPPPVETPPAPENDQDFYEDPDNPPPSQTQLPPPIPRPSQGHSPQVPRRQPPPIPVQTQKSVPGHRAPPPPPGVQNKLPPRQPQPPVLETQDVYEIPDEPSTPEQPDYLDMKKPDKKVEEQELYEVPDPDEEATAQTPPPKSKVHGGVSVMPGISPSQIKAGQKKVADNAKHNKEKKYLKEKEDDHSKHNKEKKKSKEKVEEKTQTIRNQRLPSPPKATEERSLPKPLTKELPPEPSPVNKSEYIKPPKPPGRKDVKKETPTRKLPTPPPSETPTRKLPSPPPSEPDSDDLSSYPWYHRDIDRSEADRRLKENGTTGVYLIRNSSKANQPYTLAILFEDKVYNLPVRKRADDKYAMGAAKKKEQAFDKVSQMVDYFKIHHLILAGTKTGISLKTPLPK